MKACCLWISFVLILPMAALASAPDKSVRPDFRIIGPNFTKSVTPSAINFLAPNRSYRPLVRPFGVQRELIQAGEGSKRQTLFERLRKSRPLRKLKGSVSKNAAKGSLCGVRGIEGQRIKPVSNRVKGCGIREPVKVTAVSGVVLSQSSIMECSTAKALNEWVNSSLRPAVGRKGGGVKSLKVAAHYACRTRNNRKGARISEHGKGRAIDISAINLANGTSLTVLKDWRSRNAKIMKKIHKGACGPFGTVLGPNSDRHHKDHFHFDTARYRSGPYCR